MAGHQRASLFLEGPGRRFSEIMTPEGVPLPVEIASYGDRIGAFLLDLVFWLLASFVLVILLVALMVGGFATPLLLPLIAFTSFFFRNIYFIHFELAWQGQTPGKRLLGLRVIDRGGAPLSPGAVMARNLTREVEAFMPLGLLTGLGGGGGAGVSEDLLLGGWLIAFALLPLFNRDRLRGGDFIAGTMVIALGKRSLASDLAEAAKSFTFSEAQLGVYGAFELQILEEMLRAMPTADTVRLRGEICEKICRKIGWDGVVKAAEIDDFLRDFYTAERAHLERAQLFDKGRADKNAPARAPV